MKLREIYKAETLPIVSFEVYPPKEDFDGAKTDKLIEHLKILSKHRAAFASLTYGAGGSTRESSLDIIKRIQDEVKLEVMPHFTCVATKKSHIREYLANIEALNIENILALRGDIPEGMTDIGFDFHHANDIVRFIKSETNLSVGVAGYPEGHISCDDFDLDIKYLKQKVESGAETIFTQMFFDNNKFLKFRDCCEKVGINIPIAAGIMVIRSYAQINKMLSMGRVTLPSNLMSLLEQNKDNPEAIKKIGIDFAT